MPFNGPLSEIALAAEFSRLAYLRFEANDLPRLDSALQHLGFGKATVFGGPAGTQAFGSVRAQDGLRVIAVRGTQPLDWQDLLSDANVLPADHEGHKVHSGFLRSANEVKGPMAAWLVGLPPLAGRIIVCGHSLGAAVATLLAAPLKASRLITVGSPRVGDQGFGTWLAARDGLQITRVVDCVDVVTMVPFGSDGTLHPSVTEALQLLAVPILPLLFTEMGAAVAQMLQRATAHAALPYRHVGQALYIPASGGPVAVTDPTAIAADRTLALGLRLDKKIPTRLLSDHAPINYVRAFWPQ